MNIGKIQIRNNYRTTIAWLDVDGTPGELIAKTRKGWNADVDIVLKLKGEKAYKVTTISDIHNVYTLPELLEEYIDTDCVAKWAYSLEDHTA